MRTTASMFVHAQKIDHHIFQVIHRIPCFLSTFSWIFDPTSRKPGIALPGCVSSFLGQIIWNRGFPAGCGRAFLALGSKTQTISKYGKPLRSDVTKSLSETGFVSIRSTDQDGWYRFETTFELLCSAESSELAKGSYEMTWWKVD